MVERERERERERNGGSGCFVVGRGSVAVCSVTRLGDVLPSFWPNRVFLGALPLAKFELLCEAARAVGRFSKKMGDFSLKQSGHTGCARHLVFVLCTEELLGGHTANGISSPFIQKFGCFYPHSCSSGSNGSPLFHGPSFRQESRGRLSWG